MKTIGISRLRRAKPHYRTIAAAAAGVALCSCSPLRQPRAIPVPPREIKQHMRETGSKLSLVHIWATWCQPCREEFPELLEACHAYRKDGLNLILVSADDPGNPETVETFLREHRSPVDSLISTELDQAFIELFSTNWSGALPATFFFDSNGNLVAEWEGKRSLDEYAKTIEKLLKP